MEVDSILRDLETTYDEYGRIIDTRFDEDTQEFIREFLKAKKVEFNDTGYMSLRNACYGLKAEDRLDLCKMLEIKTNKIVDADGRYRSVGNNFFNKASGKTRAIVGGVAGAGAGALVQNTKQDLFTNLSADKTMKGISDSITSKVPDIDLGLTKIELGSSLAGAANTVLSGPLNAVITAINGIANIGGGALVGAAVGFASKCVVNLVNNIVTRVKTSKKYKEFLEKDSELYEKDNEEEIAKMNNSVREEYGMEVEGHSLAA
jgi:hypothetical protein